MFASGVIQLVQLMQKRDCAADVPAPQLVIAYRFNSYSAQSHRMHLQGKLHFTGKLHFAGKLAGLSLL